MATVGQASGIAQPGALKLSGWLAWLFIHILFLISFRNRLLVMFQWAWAWFAALDGKLTSNELNDDANAFARRYYASREYFADFCEVCVRGNTVDESDAVCARLCQRLDHRFRGEKPPRAPWWAFWRR